MPVHFSQSTRLQGHERGSNGLADGEICGINLPELAAGSADFLRRML